MEKNQLSRRNFLRQLTILGASAALPLTACSAQTGEWLPAGKITDYKVGEMHSFGLPSGKTAYIQRLPGKEARLLALNNTCTHRGCPVRWDESARQFICPCHGGRYDSMGKNIAGPPPSPLATMQTKVVNGNVSVMS